MGRRRPRVISGVARGLADASATLTCGWAARVRSKT